MALLTSSDRGPKRLVVELHDVAPPFEREIRAQLDALAGMGIRRCSLHVVPDWHGANSLTRHSSLVRLLQEQYERGSELVLHGLEHRRRGPIRGPLRLRLRARIAAPAVCEFLSLSPSEVADGMHRTRLMFEACGLPGPSTFCAPGWLLAPDLYPALADAGLCRVAGMMSLYDLWTARRQFLPSLGYMAAGPVHETAIAASNELMRLTFPVAGSVQVYLHPQRGLQTVAARRVLQQVQRLVAGGWEPVTFEDLTAAS